MENLGIIISILVGLVTLLSMLVWFGRFIQRVNVHDKKLDDLSEDVEDLKLDMNSVKTLLMAKFKDFEVVFSGKHSPRALNETGQKIFDDMHGKEFLKRTRLCCLLTLTRISQKLPMMLKACAIWLVL